MIQRAKHVFRAVPYRKLYSIRLRHGNTRNSYCTAIVRHLPLKYAQKSATNIHHKDHLKLWVLLTFSFVGSHSASPGSSTSSKNVGDIGEGMLSSPSQRSAGSGGRLGKRSGLVLAPQSAHMSRYSCSVSGNMRGVYGRTSCREGRV